MVWSLVELCTNGFRKIKIVLENSGVKYKILINVSKNIIYAIDCLNI